MLRFLTAGESHGPALVVIVEGLPAGLPIVIDDIAAELARRRLGYGRGPRMRFEQDELEFLGGVRHGRTLGSPVAIADPQHRVERSDKWHDEMSAAPGATAQPAHRSRVPATPTSPACRSTASTTRATCSNARAPRDRGARRGRRDREALLVAHRVRVLQPRRAARCRATRRPSAARSPTTSTRSTRRRCAASTRRPKRRWSPRSRRRRRRATRSAASSRCSRTACRPGSGRTCTGTAASTGCSPRR